MYAYSTFILTYEPFLVCNKTPSNSTDPLMFPSLLHTSRISSLFLTFLIKESNIILLASLALVHPKIASINS